MLPPTYRSRTPECLRLLITRTLYTLSFGVVVMNLYLSLCISFVLIWMTLLSSQNETFASLVLVNGALQMSLFIVVACIPLRRTGRMSYVDIAWPFGIATIGVLILALADGNTVRKLTVGAVYLFIGLRMGLGALTMARATGVIFKKEFPRYRYRRMALEQSGSKHIGFHMQVDVLTQGLANISVLALPAFLIATNKSASIDSWEVIGLGLWGLAYTLESIADVQKMLFISKNRGGVCNVGLWRYTRHPNYFSEWLVWCGLAVASVPSWLASRAVESSLVWWVSGLGVLGACMMMYLTLVYLTGAIPSEYYSVRKRADYAAYQETTNIFFPWFPRKQ
jgi:steroid 5-alpha reductase family enzyme